MEANRQCCEWSLKYRSINKDTINSKRKIQRMDRKRVAAVEKTLSAFKNLKKKQLSESTLRDCFHIACDGYLDEAMPQIDEGNSFLNNLIYLCE